MPVTIREILAPRRIAMIVEQARDVRQTMMPAFASRVLNDDTASENDLTAKFLPSVVAADVVADGGKARVRSTDPVKVESYKAPNLKTGVSLDQERLQLLGRLTSSGLPGDLAAFDAYLVRVTSDLLNGVACRRASLVMAMLVDSSTYSAFGVQWSNMTWGMPADQKVTLAAGRRWLAGNEATALPVTDVLALRRIGRRRGVIFDRVTMSETALLFMATTAEFRNLAQLRFPNTLNASLGLDAAIPTEALSTMAGQLLGMTVEVEDAMFTTEAESGARTDTNRYLPENVVLLSSTAFDGNRNAYDFANGEVTESRLASLGAQIVGAGDMPANARGPVSYWTMPPDMNPPSLTGWAVQRGFPRKHFEAATAALTVS